LKDFFESFLFIIANKHFTKHKFGTFNLQKQKWMFNLQEQEQELSTLKNKNFQPWRIRTFNIQEQEQERLTFKNKNKNFQHSIFLNLKKNSN